MDKTELERVFRDKGTKFLQDMVDLSEELGVGIQIAIDTLEGKFEALIIDGEGHLKKMKELDTVLSDLEDIASDISKDKTNDNCKSKEYTKEKGSNIITPKAFAKIIDKEDLKEVKDVQV